MVFGDGVIAACVKTRTAVGHKPVRKPLPDSV